MGGGEDVEITSYGQVENADKSWPSGEFLVEILKKHGAKFLGQEADPGYWQVSVRWALMRKFGFPELPAGDNPYEKVEDRWQLEFSQDCVDSIHQRWASLVRQDDPSNDLLQFLSESTSNGRTLEWSVMDCKPGCQFKLHAHPNLELIYCIKGALHEVRMEGLPIEKEFETLEDDGTELKGPNLASLDRPWHFETLSAGQWLANEVGSVHKSFTATSGDGALLLVLWGGSHANIVDGEAPELVDVNQAVDDMDKKLDQCDCTKWTEISETFLPESEKKKE